MENEKVIKKVVEEVFRIERKQIHLKSINDSVEKTMVKKIVDLIINNTKS